LRTIADAYGIQDVAAELDRIKQEHSADDHS